MERSRKRYQIGDFIMLGLLLIGMILVMIQIIELGG